MPLYVFFSAIYFSVSCLLFLAVYVASSLLLFPSLPLSVGGSPSRPHAPRLFVAITTGAEGDLPRCKPFKYTYEKEIVLYAYFKKLDYFSTECIYSPNAYR